MSGHHRATRIGHRASIDPGLLPGEIREVDRIPVTPEKPEPPRALRAACVAVMALGFAMLFGWAVHWLVFVWILG